MQSDDKKSLKIPKGSIEVEQDNTMTKSKSTKGHGINAYVVENTRHMRVGNKEIGQSKLYIMASAHDLNNKCQ